MNVFDSTDGTHGRCLYVDADATSDPGPNDLAVSDPDEDGTVEHPYDSIQEAIEMACHSDRIVVLSGTYYETIDFLGKSIHVTGFNPFVEAQRDQPCPVIDGDYRDTVVTFAGGEDLNARLSGFTITRGIGPLAGGILCMGSHPRISNCLIVGNRAHGPGGGGVYCSDSHARFDRCTISGNHGGPMETGFYSIRSSNRVTNSVLWGNRPDDVERAMHGQAPESSTIFMYSVCPFGVKWPGNITCDPCFVSPGYWANVSYPDLPIDVPDTNAVWIEGDYHLEADSPCVNAGDPDVFADLYQSDLDGQPRFAYGRMDMGSDEYVFVGPGYVATYDGTVIPLSQDIGAAHPETTYMGRATLRFDAPERRVLLPLVSAVSKAGGLWTVSLSDEEIGPGQCIGVELTVEGRRVDVHSLEGTFGNTAVAAVEIVDGLEIEFVPIDDPGFPKHGGFRGQMSKFEITNAQYCQYLNQASRAGEIIKYYGSVYDLRDDRYEWPYFDTHARTPTSQITYVDGRYRAVTRDGVSMVNHPVVEVTWLGANAFCRFYGYRLPTEWEWQAVADYDGSYVFGCGTSIDQDRANFWNDATANPHDLSEFPHTSRVGFYPPTGYGLCDMAGNAWEWTDTAISSRYQILCGGAWTEARPQNEVSYRGGFGTLDSFHSIGFRVCR